MATEPTEDVPYSVDEFATEDPAPDPEDTDTTGLATIRRIRKYLKTEIAKGNTLDVLHLPQNASDEEKVAVFNEAAIHKGVVMHLRNIQETINNMVKE